MTRIQPKSAVSMHCWRGIAIISLIVGAMLFRVWQKVEVAHMDRQYDQAQHQLVALNEERTRLMAGIAFRNMLSSKLGIGWYEAFFCKRAFVRALD